MNLIKELCIDGTSKLTSCNLRKIERVELCAHLEVGGTTPFHEMIREVVEMVKPYGVKVMVIVRPRGGDFVYSKFELNQMKQEILNIKKLGADGVVFGVLTNQNRLDKQHTIELLEVCEGLEVTFHMAFDAIEDNYKHEALIFLKDANIQRLLTHGGIASTSIEDNIESLKKYQDMVGNQLIVMPGGGVTKDNMKSLAEKLNLFEVHGTRLV